MICSLPHFAPCRARVLSPTWRRSGIASAAAFSTLLLAAIPASARQTYKNWIGGNGGNIWSDAANWNPTGAPSSSSSLNLVFDNTANPTSTNDLGALTLNILSFTGTSSTTLNATADSSLNFVNRPTGSGSSSGPAIYQFSTAANIVNQNINYSANTGLLLAGNTTTPSGDLTINGNITGGSFTQYGTGNNYLNGTSNVSQLVVLGDTTGSGSLLNIMGGTLTTGASGFFVTSANTTLRVSGGALLSTGSGTGYVSSGTVDVAGANSRLSMAQSVVATGACIVEDGGRLTTSGSTFLGNGNSGTAGSGSLLVRSGGSAMLGSLVLGYQAGDSGTYTVTGSGSTLTVNGSLSSGSGNGNGTVSGNGRLMVGGTLSLNAADSLTVNTGGQATIGALAGAGTLRLANPVGDKALIVGGANQNTVFSGTIQDSDGVVGGISKIGTGTLTLAGNNSYTGGTEINAGTLVVNGSLSATTPLSIASGATLAGSGSVGIVTQSGIIAPGFGSVATLSLTSLTLGNGANFLFDLGATTASGTDLLSVAGAFDFAAADGTFPVGFSTSSNTVALNQTYKLARYGSTNFDASTINTRFSAAAGNGTTSIGGTFSLVSDGTGNYVAFTPTTFQPVPVSPMWVTLPTGLFCLGVSLRGANQAHRKKRPQGSYQGLA